MSLTPKPLVDEPSAQARRGGRDVLAVELQASRADTLSTLAAYEAALDDARLAVPYRSSLNPPLWELGHIGWFQEFWTGRNPQRGLGHRADPEAPRPESLRPGGDALYNSSRVPHDRRWQLPLPDAAATRADLARQLEQTLELLAATAGDDDALYFYRLSLFHEDMHHEAALYMARGLDIAIADPRWQPRALPAPGGDLAVAGGPVTLGSGGPGFAFDNELQPMVVDLPDYRIDRQAVRWAEFLPFVEAGGYGEARLWSAEGWQWRQMQQRQAPLYLRREGDAWLERWSGNWRPLDPAQAASHLTFHEAAAWCRWAGRRLPTEAEWEHAATGGLPGFEWGAVWEWTASPFTPYPGFVRHPYRDYSAPWFDGRPVLRGASWATQPRMRHPRYRNYFAADRDDIVAGFRSCAA